MKRLAIGLAALALLASLPAEAQDRGGRGRGDGWQQDGRGGRGGGDEGRRRRDGDEGRGHHHRHRHHWWEDFIRYLPIDGGYHRGRDRDYDRRR